MLEQLMEHEILKWAVSIGVGLAAFFSYFAGTKERSKKESVKSETISLLLQKLQLIHEDVEELKKNSLDEQVRKLSNDFDSFSKVVPLLMEWVETTHSKVNSIDVAIKLMQQLERQRNNRGSDDVINS